MIALEIHICDQRRSYVARFSAEDQAIAFLAKRSATHAWSETKEEPISGEHKKLMEYLYPLCEHQMLGDCYGPNHFYNEDA